ncbi:MAG: hypothetical protein IKN71_03435 [Alphaproteobacteria bacterium]|nr:hypothetical protein [Alphaproteobacteria bacterium]
MRKMNVNRAAKSRDFILSAPINGLNARDSIDAMDPLYAITMDNYIPLDSKIQLRPGYSKHANFSEIGDIYGLAAYRKPNNNRFIAISNGKAYNITSGATITELGSISGNVDCQNVQYKDRLFFVNGSDTPKVFYIDDNTQEHFGDWGFSSENLTASKIINAAVSKEFLWFVERGSLKAWYSAQAGYVSGTLNSFDLSQISKYGGELIAIADWTVDGGQGIDDLTVFVTSEGEIFVYSGSNPNSASSWELKGSYKMSKPIGYNCLMPYQGDIVIISEDGYIPLSRALSLGASGQSNYAFSDNIRGLVLDRTSKNKRKTGWQGIIYTKRGYGIFNVPVDNRFEQHVINVNTGAWCRFTGINSRCWCEYEGNLYFAAPNYVYKFDDSLSDDGLDITGHIEQAYNNLGTNALKRIPLLNPKTKCSNDYNLVIYTNMDYENQKVDYYTSISVESGTKWNIAKWDLAKWSCSKANIIRSQWIENSAIGYKASIVFKTKTKGRLIEWYNTGIRYEVGSGIL